MAEDLDDHRRIFDGGDDLQGAAAVRAVFDVDVEDPFEQPGPAQQRAGAPGIEILNHLFLSGDISPAMDSKGSVRSGVLFLDCLSAWVLSLFSSMILFYTIQVYSDLASPFDSLKTCFALAGGLPEIDIFLPREKFTPGT